MVDGLFMFVMFFLALFLILLVLVQRGRGGGLAGALGGMGGQSAFGTKAGDLFTRITIGVVFVWIVLQAVAVKYFDQGAAFDERLGRSATQSPEGGGFGEAAPGTPAAPAGSPAGGTSTSPESGTAPSGSAPPTSTPPSSAPAETPPADSAPPAGSSEAPQSP